jgi:hypothetical protein
MSERPTPEDLPEPELNELLRQVDWRFLIGQEEAPLIADLTAGRHSRAVQLIGRGEPPPGAADVAVIGYPTKLALSAARDMVRLGGAVVCLWRAPRIGGSGRAVARLRRAGLSDVRVFWPGPQPRRTPQFWLPLESTEATSHVLSSREARSSGQALLRRLWKGVAACGLLAPLCAIAWLPTNDEEGDAGDIWAAPPGPAPLLLTGGRRSINKVVALTFADGRDEPTAAVKFARVAAADAGLDREAAALRRIEDEHPKLPGVPRLLEQRRRVGRRALVESALRGTPLIAGLTTDRFEELAVKVTRWLIELARGGEPEEPGQWWERLVTQPLRAFERNFGPVLPADLMSRLDATLSGLGPLPLVCEHRDCSPWNVVLADGKPGLLDWESAEVDGLPGLDLSYFLANAAFVLDNALETGRTRESYKRLLDPTTPYGAIATRCEGEYGEELGLERDDLARLRLLAWLVHSRSDFNHLAMEAGGRPGHKAMRASTYLGMVEIEMASGAGRS